MGKFSPVFPMTWVLFKEGARSNDESVSGGSAERRAEPESRGPKEDPKRRKPGFTREKGEELG